MKNAVQIITCLASGFLVLCSFTPALGEKGKPARGTLSPDGSARLFTSTEGGDAEIYTSLPDGSGIRKLTDNDKVDNGPVWSLDSKHIAFFSNRSGRHQVYVMDADGNHVRQVTHEEKGIGGVRYGPDGRLVYSALRAQKHKQRQYDLIVTDGTVAITIARGLDIADFAWSPDGRILAYGATGQLVFHHLENGRKRAVNFPEVHDRLHAHAADNIRWRPDSRAITCKIRFVGGRLAGTKIFGDDEVFVITTEGKTSWSVPGE